MINLAMTAGDDNTLILLTKITLRDSTVLKYSNKDITLSSNSWSGTIITGDSIQPINESLRGVIGGISQIGDFTFTISRYSGTYIDDFAPSTSKPILSGAKIEVGFVWSGATTEAEITWYFIGFIDSVTLTPFGLTLTCLQNLEIDEIGICVYKFQKNDDNGISYFPYAEDSLFGVPMPIIYGDYTTWTGQLSTYVLSPAFLVDRNLMKFAVSCHKLHTTSYYSGDYVIYSFVKSVGAYIQWTNTTITQANTNAGSYIDLQFDGSEDEPPTGTCIMQFVESGKTLVHSDASAVFDKDDTNYMVLEQDEALAALVGGTARAEDFGATNGLIDFYVSWNIIVDSGTRDIDISFKEPNGNEYTENIPDAGTGVSSQYEDTPSWEPEYLTQTEYRIVNNSADSLKVVNGWLEVQNIRWFGTKRIEFSFTVPSLVSG